MIIRSSTIVRHSCPGNRIQIRTLFKGLKEATKQLEKVNKKKDDEEGFHHEYSIRPDTYAFKVSGANERNRSLAKNSNGIELDTESKIHPLQKQELDDTEKFNLIQFIYRYSTNYPFGTKSPQDVYDEYPLTNSDKLARSIHRPKKVKMSTSDFIEDSLYNPNYGYFSQEVNIYQPDTPFDYNNIKDIDEFMDSWQKSYAKYDDAQPISIPKPEEQKAKEDSAKYSNKVQEESSALVKSNATGSNSENANVSTSKFASRAISIQKQDMRVAEAQTLGRTRKSLQLWHTPTELFQPFYGEAIARYLLVNYKLNGNYPYEDLIIYEMGGGNGTLMCNILNYIRETQPDVYARTQYKIIEISSQLANKQMENALKNKLVQKGLDTSKLEIVNKSIFKWDKVIDQPCYFIALEVFDNFAHDLIRYDNITGQPHEAKVLIDGNGDFFEFYTPELSYYSNAYLQLRENGDYSVLEQSGTLSGKLETLKSVIPFLSNKDKIHPLLHSTTKLRWQNSILPFKDNLTPGEFIPTRLLQFFQILKHRFPNHSLISSDFHYLPKAMKGYYNGPVVQTVLKNQTVDVSTYMCHQGYFDIMFPTDFGVASDLYKQVTGKIPRVESHKEFLSQWADIDATTTKTGENPMLDFYRNVSFMVS
ncbi:S-adenosyl-L-methionine-dependent methyltransferase [Scheffersomyces xylosifermentans]|uniref:S-adenosyl-L-methionine-dependent methyltransferase n=1 Tax=Scheffersomyces xylosifermentans TaxID=1304137 RepID=UPI00315CC559